MQIPNFSKVKCFITLFILLLTPAILPAAAYDSNFDPINAQAYGDIKSGDTIKAAIAAIGSHNRSLLLSTGTWKISSELTISSNITLIIGNSAILEVNSSQLHINGVIKILPGSSLSISQGSIVKFSKPIEADAYPIFQGDGLVVFKTNATVYPEWFGAIANEPLIDCQKSIIRAYNSLSSGGTLEFTSGFYTVASDLTVPRHIDMKFSGQSRLFRTSGTIHINSATPVDIRWFGANGYPYRTKGNIGAGQQALKVINPSGFFPGNGIAIEGAGPGGKYLRARITSVHDNTIMLDTPAATTVPNAGVAIDESFAVQDALNAVKGSTRGGRVEVPRGIYYVYNTVYMDGINIIIAGEGRMVSQLIAGTPNLNLIQLTDRANGVIIKDLTLQVFGSGGCIYKPNNKVFIDSYIEGVWFIGGVDGGTQLKGYFQNVFVRNCLFESGYNAIEFTGGGIQNISDCLFNTMKGTLINATSASHYRASMNFNNLVFINDQDIDANSYAIRLDNYKDINISNVTGSRTLLHKNNKYAYGIFLTIYYF